MSYLTGGLAYGEVKINGTNAVSGEALIGSPCVCHFLFSNTLAFGDSHVNTGWVVGSGTEGHLPLMPGNWTWKIEGRWMDLGTLDATGSGGSSSVTPLPTLSPPGFTTAVGPVTTTHSHFTDGILRAGLNYKFY
jgi:opacity protein-like surface antigen